MDNRLTGEQAVRFIKSRKLITSPGKYNLQVIGEPNHYEDKVIINLKATSAKLLEDAKEELREGNFDKAANSNFTFSPFAESAYIPAKGEHVACMVDWVEGRDGGQVLVITACTEIKSSATSRVNLGDEFANLLDEAPASDNMVAE